MTKTKISPDLQIWIEARKRFRLSHAHVQMARELGMNPKKLGGLTYHKQEPSKAPLPEFIERLYEDRFGRNRPENVLSIEDRAVEISRKRRPARLNVQRRECRPRSTTAANFYAAADFGPPLITMSRVPSMGSKPVSLGPLDGEVHDRRSDS